MTDYKFKIPKEERLYTRPKQESLVHSVSTGFVVLVAFVSLSTLFSII